MFEEVVSFILEAGQVRRKGPSGGVQVTCVHCRAVFSAIGHPLLRSSASLGLFHTASTPASCSGACRGLIRSAYPSSIAWRFILWVPHGCTPSAVWYHSSSLPVLPPGRSAATSVPSWGFLLNTPPGLYVRWHHKAGTRHSNAVLQQDSNDQRNLRYLAGHNYGKKGRNAKANGKKTHYQPHDAWLNNKNNRLQCWVLYYLLLQCSN